jgi:acetolactate synthase-1/2/3 large subunit
LVLQELDEGVSRAFGQGGDPGPVYLDFPTNTLRSAVPEATQLDEHFRPKPLPLVLPDPGAVAQAVDILWSAHRPVVIAGRGARGAGPELMRLLDRLGAVYLDTVESRGLLPDNHPALVSAMRWAVLSDADVVLTVGRRLDFQLAYGSPGVFGAARFIRVADIPSELRDNRRGVVELLATPAAALAAVVDAADSREPAVDRAWAARLRELHEARRTKSCVSMAAAESGRDGRMHPNRLLSALQAKLPPHTTVIADGGDFLSFARVGLSSETYLDAGSFGCLGVGVPFGIAAALARPDRQVVVATGDGSFGFNAMEVDTAVRHGVPLVIVVANNGAWQIEVHDQLTTYGRVVGTRLQHSDYAALARSFGMYAERVESPEDLPAALDRAFAQQPSLLDVLVTTDAVSGDAKSGLAWVPDLQPLAAWHEADHRWRHGVGEAARQPDTPSSKP